MMMMIILKDESVLNCKLTDLIREVILLFVYFLTAVSLAAFIPPHISMVKFCLPL